MTLNIRVFFKASLDICFGRKGGYYTQQAVFSGVHTAIGQRIQPAQRAFHKTRVSRRGELFALLSKEEYKRREGWQ